MLNELHVYRVPARVEIIETGYIMNSEALLSTNQTTGRVRLVEEANGSYAGSSFNVRKYQL